MPAGFTNCVKKKGRVRTVKGPNRKFKLAAGEYRHTCFLGQKMFLGEIHKKKKRRK